MHDSSTFIIIILILLFFSVFSFVFYTHRFLISNVKESVKPFFS